MKNIEMENKDSKIDHAAANDDMEVNENNKTDNKENMTFEISESPNNGLLSENKNNITCEELFEILNPNKKSSERVLIIDVRNGEEYSKAKISFPEKMVHIPAEKIQSNKVPGYYRYLLLHDEEAEKRFSRRSPSYTDIIVLIDSNSSVDSLDNNSPIAIFKYCLEEFDVHIQYKRIAILKGGFNQWLKMYPDYVTNVPTDNQS